jgi:hypothetical protein
MACNDLACGICGCQGPRGATQGKYAVLWLLGLGEGVRAIAFLGFGRWPLRDKRALCW